MEFDKILSREINGETIEYGILEGNEKLLFIKSGKGGSYRGYNDKYLRFAAFSRGMNGCSVICSSNPMECKSSYAEDISVICEYIAQKGFTEAELYLMGNSDGCFKVLEIAANVNAAKTVIINMPLMINFYRTKEKIKSLPCKDIAFVYGDKDPSNIYLDYLRSLPFGKFVTLENTAHNISLDEKETAIMAELLFS